MLNAIGRELPEHVDGYGRVIPFAGAFAARPIMRRHAPPLKTVRPGESKLVGDIGEALEKVGIRDGMTLSFHHHLRNGDGVVNAVVHAASELGVKDLKVASSSVFPVHAPMVEHFESGVVTSLDTDFNTNVVTGSDGTIMPRPAEVGEKIVAVVEYRDGTLIDVVRQVAT